MFDTDALTVTDGGEVEPVVPEDQFIFINLEGFQLGIGNLQREEELTGLMVLLPEIRRVVAAGVADALSGFQISQSAAGIDPGVEEETENMLDQLGGFLILDETAISGRSRP